MKELVKKLRKLLENKEIKDIILFGSSVKGKIEPNDVDVAVLVHEKSNEIRMAVKKIMPKPDVQLISIEDIKNTIFLTLIKEGFSVAKNEYLHKIYGIKPTKLYKYHLKQLSPSKKVMFERGIKKIKGIQKLSNSVVLVPIEHTENFEDFLKFWELDIDTQEYELIPLLRKEMFE